MGLPMSIGGCSDKVIWHYSKDGDYTVRTGYDVAMEMQENGELGRKRTGSSNRWEDCDRVWREIWSLVMPNRMKFFICRCCNDSLQLGSTFFDDECE
ncbi:hypothetical protein ACFX11_032846 [Malus domestica]